MPASTDQNIAPVTPAQTFAIHEGPNDLTIEAGEEVKGLFDSRSEGGAIRANRPLR